MIPANTGHGETQETHDTGKHRIRETQNTGNTENTGYGKTQVASSSEIRILPTSTGNIEARLLRRCINVIETPCLGSDNVANS